MKTCTALELLFRDEFSKPVALDFRRVLSVISTAKLHARHFDFIIVVLKKKERRKVKKEMYYTKPAHSILDGNNGSC